VGQSIAARCGGGMLRVGRREEEGGSDGWGPLGSDVRGNAIDGLRYSKKRHYLANTPRLLRPSGPSARTAAYGRSGQAARGYAGWAGIRGKNDFRIKFEFLNI
jgi:hypothetical protein